MNSNAYMNEYMQRRYRTRRAEALTILGGEHPCCVRCGSVDRLEIDHIDPATKLLDLGKLWSVAKARYLDELAKCQLLCHDCHAAKSAEEESVDHGGGMTGKKNCRCALCGPLKRKDQARRRDRHRARVAELTRGASA